MAIGQSVLMYPTPNSIPTLHNCYPESRPEQYVGAPQTGHTGTDYPNVSPVGTVEVTGSAL
jgi:hypothetical protein